MCGKADHRFEMPHAALCSVDNLRTRLHFTCPLVGSVLTVKRNAFVSWEQTDEEEAGALVERSKMRPSL